MTPPDPLVDALLAKDAWLRREARRRVPDPDGAEDLVQEVWLAALERRPSCDRSLEPWLVRVLSNRTARRQRDRASTPRASDEAAVDGVAAEQVLALRERREGLRRLVRELEEPYRTTLFQRFFEERSIGEIARLGTQPRATVSTRLRRGLDRLRQALRDRRGLVAWLGLPPTRGERLASGAALPVGLVAVSGCLLVVWIGGGERLSAAGAAPADGLRADHGEPITGTRPASAPVRSALAPGSPRARPEPASPATSGRRSFRVSSGEDRSPRGAAEILLEHPRGARVVRTTDATGRASVPADWPANGELVVTLARDDGPGVRRRLGPDQREVSFGDGAVVFVRNDEIAHRDPDELVFALRRAEPGAFGYPPLTYGPGRRADELQVQLPSHLRHNQSVELSLVVSTPDGLAGMITPLDDAALRGERVLAPAWRPLASIACALVDEGDVPATRGVAWLRPLTARSAWPLEPDVIDGHGYARLAALEPGDYELTVDCPPHPVTELALTLAAGVTTVERVRLAPPPASGPIRGRLVSRSTRCREDAIVALEAERSPQFLPLVWRETERGLVAEFEFEDVAAGAYTLRPVALQTFRTIDPPNAAVRPGGPPVEFVLRDDEPVEDLELEVTSDGRRVEDYLLEVRVGDGPRYRVLHCPDDVLGSSRWRFGTHGMGWSSRTGAALPSVPLGVPIEWTVSKDGHGSVSGDRASFTGGLALVELSTDG